MESTKHSGLGLIMFAFLILIYMLLLCEVLRSFPGLQYILCFIHVPATLLYMVFVIGWDSCCGIWIL